MLLEAQASGLPIVTTHAGSIPEVVGDVAILVEQKNPKQLYEALKILIQDKKKRVEYGKAARNRAVKVHGAKVIAEKIAAVYESIL
jgi:glycosyltransferase involved in cell wall biosynthesis